MANNSSTSSPKRQQDMSTANRTSPRPEEDHTGPQSELQERSRSRGHHTGQQNELQRRPRSLDTVGNRESGRSRSGAPAVRLDMDLDVDIQLKAKIQGDLELSILDGETKKS
ncbi:hypothetical protein DL546_008781 [Coniochaeta pulveracea]|uniref:Uncharacterized protein n=1 Tax=Coniochaeta pulveracea TaxID=177199 RepID=A0A420YF46_9PEZI|nr:hypothetical protein DL546_008781 [Coniochaeta pulveracea]